MKNLGPALVGLALFLIFGWVIDNSQSFQSCVNTEYSTNAHNAAQKPPKEVTPGFEIYGSCGAGFLQTAEGEGLITAFATVLIAIFTATLYTATKEQGRLTEITAGIAKDSLIFGNAAFVYVSALQPRFYVDKDGNVTGWVFKPMWKNAGKTQTRAMTTHVDGDLFDTELPPKFPFADTHINIGHVLLGPDAPPIEGGHHRFFTIQELELVKSQKKFLYIWGWARYRDIFPDSPEHLTRYCYRVVVDGDPADSNGGAKFTYPFIARGNCCDAECIDQGIA